MPETWKTPVTWFALFNLLGAPFIGRGIWAAMQALHGEKMLAAAVAVSLVGAIGILAVNSGLTVWATRSGLPRKGQMILWLITGGTFALTIGFGTFSPVNLVIVFLGAVASGG